MSFQIKALMIIVLVFLFLASGCQEINDAMTQDLAKYRDVPDIERPPEDEVEPKPVRVVAEVETQETKELGASAEGPEVSVIDEAEGREEPEFIAPIFNGVVRRMAKPFRRGRVRGVKFDLWVSLRGREQDLANFAYEAVIRDQSGASKTLPMSRAGNTISLSEEIPNAGFKETYEYQVHYYVPSESTSTSDVEEGSETKAGKDAETEMSDDAETQAEQEPRYVLKDDWGVFSMVSDN